MSAGTGEDGTPIAGMPCTHQRPKCAPMRRGAWYCICPRPTRVMWGGNSRNDPDPPASERSGLVEEAERAAGDGAPPVPEWMLPETVFGNPCRPAPCPGCTSKSVCVVTSKLGTYYGCRKGVKP